MFLIVCYVHIYIYIYIYIHMSIFIFRVCVSICFPQLLLFFHVHFVLESNCESFSFLREIERSVAPKIILLFGSIIDIFAQVVEYNLQQ
jgi:hypothetical protein